MQKLQNIVRMLHLGDTFWFLVYFWCVFSRWFSGIKCLVKDNYLDQIIEISIAASYDMSEKHCMPISKIWPSHKAGTLFQYKRYLLTNTTLGVFRDGRTAYVHMVLWVSSAMTFVWKWYGFHLFAENDLCLIYFLNY